MLPEKLEISQYSTGITVKLHYIELEENEHLKCCELAWLMPTPKILSICYFEPLAINKS